MASGISQESARSGYYGPWVAPGGQMEVYKKTSQLHKDCDPKGTQNLRKGMANLMNYGEKTSKIRNGKKSTGFGNK